IHTPFSLSSLPPTLSTNHFPYTTLFRSFITAINQLVHLFKDGFTAMLRNIHCFRFGALCGYLGINVYQVFLDAAPKVLCLAAKRSEEHTSELQSLRHLVCRLLLEKKKKL